MTYEDYIGLGPEERMRARLDDLLLVGLTQSRVAEFVVTQDENLEEVGLVRMSGVVLWMDGDAKKAVLWCEDRGDLAFVRPDHSNENEERQIEKPDWDTGDWVEFDLDDQGPVRFAWNVSLLAENNNLRSGQIKNDSEVPKSNEVARLEGLFADAWDQNSDLKYG